jgi:hypothetical protein
VLSGKTLAAIAIVVGGAVAAFAVYTFGWHDGDTKGQPAAATHTYTLRDGDVALRPAAATRCKSSAEGGVPNLFCSRIGGGRHQVIFYKDSVIVWPLDCQRCGPDGPTFSYLWTPYLLRAGRDSQTIGGLNLRPRDPVTYEDAIRAFGKPTSCRLLGSPLDAWAIWRALGIRLRLSSLGAPPPGKNGCTAPRFIYIDSAYVTGRQWQTARGLRVGLPAEVVRRLYPDAIFQRRSVRDWPIPAYWIVHVRERCVVGLCGSDYQTAPRLIALVKVGRVTGFFFPVGAEGE